MSKKYRKHLMITVASFIILASIEVLMRAKEEALYLAFQEKLSLKPDEYRAFLLFNYIRELIIPIFFSIYYLFIFKRVQKGWLAKVSWNLLIILGLVGLTMDFYNPFFYLKLFLYLNMMLLNIVLQRSNHE